MRSGLVFRISGPDGTISASELGTAVDVPRNDPAGGQAVLRHFEGADTLVGAFPFDPAVRGRVWSPGVVARSSEPHVGSQSDQQRVELAEAPSRSEYEDSIERAVARIRSGEMAKVVIARSMSVALEDEIDPNQVFEALALGFPSAHTFLVPDGSGYLAGVSPELLVRKRGTHFETYPLAGSAARSADPEVDALNAKHLRESVKRHEEHRIVIDDMASVLATISGDVQIPAEPTLFETERIWHLGTPISGSVANPEVTSLDIANLLHPTGAVGGSPTAEALGAIARLESIDRGLYAGFFGWMDSNGDGDWYVALRCAHLAGRRASIIAGSGIVAQSTPEDEYQETAHRIAAYLDAVGWSEDKTASQRG